MEKKPFSRVLIVLFCSSSSNLPFLDTVFFYSISAFFYKQRKKVLIPGLDVASFCCAAFMVLFCGAEAGAAAAGACKARGAIGAAVGG